MPEPRHHIGLVAAVGQPTSPRALSRGVKKYRPGVGRFDAPAAVVPMRYSGHISFTRVDMRKSATSGCCRAVKGVRLKSFATARDEAQVASGET